ncbi:transporter [Mycobacterium sp. 852013-50091_SCH5140682]|uniref:OFA family MFS transporter n=1 Tax=Mycobacterium sp. 852013-50091_SCH5140682 TaxID=1834109 RepID=UPI0007EA530D|nr:OFA family MFS transporter [Mycobacterium sp. 852013-50091_SCH5140682]OBC04579.1 transporter [Mycobacterium sp. 852013-50091_SCH5140682]
MSDTAASVTVLEVRDLRGRSYRVGERPHDIIGRSRTWMLWLSWAAMAAIGVLQYGFGVAVTALHTPEGSNATGAYWVLALWLVFQAGAAYPTATLSHRSAVPPARAMLVGAILCASGPLTLAYTDSFVLAVLGYSVLCGSGAGIVYATCASTVAKWYPERRGVRVGFVTGAFGYGAVPAIALFATVLTPTNRSAIFTAVGIGVLVVVAGCGVLLRDPPPAWWPPDIDPRVWAVDRRLNPSLLSNVSAVRQYSPGQAIRTPAFVIMYLILVFAAAAALLPVAYLPGMAMAHGFSLAVSASAVGLLAAVNGAGRTVAGRISDRFGRRRTISAVLALEGCAQLGLVYSFSIGQPTAFVLFAVLGGLAGGAFYPLFASLIADYFGERNAVRNFGLVYSAKLFGGLIGVGLPTLMLSSRGLSLLFVAAGLLSLCAAAMTRMLNRPGYPALGLPH